MSPLLLAALEEARTLGPARGWSMPSIAAIAEAQRLLELVADAVRAPSVEVEPTGEIALAWEAGAYGWLELVVAGRGTVTHSAVIDGDEYGEVEDFGGDALPGWAAKLLGKLLAAGH
jgi:hypothetical protein